MCQDCNCWRLEIRGGAWSPAVPLAPSSRGMQPMGVCGREKWEHLQSVPRALTWPRATPPHKFPLPQRGLLDPASSSMIILSSFSMQETRKTTSLNIARLPRRWYFSLFFVTWRNKDPSIQSIHSLNINKKVYDVLNAKKCAVWSMPSGLVGVTGHRPVGLLSHCYTVIQGSRCWDRLLDPACFLAKAGESAPAGPFLFPVPGPYRDPMQKSLIRQIVEFSTT